MKHFYSSWSTSAVKKNIKIQRSFLFCIEWSYWNIVCSFTLIASDKLFHYAPNVGYYICCKLYVSSRDSPNTYQGKMTVDFTNTTTLNQDGQIWTMGKYTQASYQTNYWSNKIQTTGTYEHQSFHLPKHLSHFKYMMEKVVLANTPKCQQQFGCKYLFSKADVQYTFLVYM